MTDRGETVGARGGAERGGGLALALTIPHNFFGALGKWIATAEARECSALATSFAGWFTESSLDLWGIVRRLP
ncbi:MAG TPA: hypothetical protein VFU49_16700 [Ktedonobacteraceae bacterium]|nr:hypothetical protein [Ktedonobacteraceae bacterium]